MFEMGRQKRAVAKARAERRCAGGVASGGGRVGAVRGGAPDGGAVGSGGSYRKKLPCHGRQKSFV